MIPTKRMKAAQSAAMNALAYLDFVQDCEAARIAIEYGGAINQAANLQEALTK